MAPERPPRKIGQCPEALKSRGVPPSFWRHTATVLLPPHLLRQLAKFADRRASLRRVSRLVVEGRFN